MSLRCCLKIPVLRGQEKHDLQRILVKKVAAIGFPDSVVTIPSLEFGRYELQGDQVSGRISAILMVPDVAGLESAQRLLDVGSSLEVDPQIAAFDTFPDVDSWTFGDRTLANELIAANRLPDRANGTGVNVAIIDRGLSRDILPAGSFKGGWWRYAKRGRQLFEPGGTGSDHAHMIARNVLAVAPGASIWDVPLLSYIDDEPPSIAMAEALFYYIRRDLPTGTRRVDYVKKFVGPKVSRALANSGNLAEATFEGPWILVNAWGVMNPAQFGVGEEYVSNPENKFIQDMAKFSALSSPTVDIVFAAGNCGEPSALPRCGMDWSGPGRSILGANGHPDVLTVGAVRADGLPLGFSAQGPGRLAARWPPADPKGKSRARKKPDVCAPSSFVESNDANILNSGTSAAAGIAAGVLAAIRSAELSANRTPVSPETMRRILRRSARKVANQRVWDERLGFGVMDCMAAMRLLGL